MLKDKIRTVLEKPAASWERTGWARHVARMRDIIEDMRFISRLVCFLSFQECACKVNRFCLAD